MKREEFEKLLKSKHGAVPMAAVDMPLSGGTAYLRQPTPDEFATLQLMSEDDKGAAFSAYVKACFIGAISKDGTELSFDAVASSEGPAYIRGGSLGKALNRLAGIEAATTRFF